MKECKRCLLREAAEEDLYADIQSRVAKLPAAQRADEAVVRARLEQCQTCDHLISGVCMKCGCYVEFRAACKRMKCPNASDRRW